MNGVRLEDVDCAGRKQRLRLMRREDTLAGRDRDPTLATHALERRQRLGGNRFLDPADAVYGQQIDDPDRALRREPPVRVDEELDVGADCLPYRRDKLDRAA